MSDLRFDGDSFTDDLGYTFTMTSSSDDWDWHRYGDDDCDMQVSEFVDYGRDYDINGCPLGRPDGFDGAAVKIRLRDGFVWAQPRFEVWGLTRAAWHADADMRRQEIARARTLLEDGYVTVTVTMTDQAGDEVARASLSSIECDAASDYIGSITSELVEQCRWDNVQRIGHHNEQLVRRLVPAT